MTLDEVLEREFPGTREQRSDEWFAARVGKITGSGMGHLCPGRKGSSFYSINSKWASQYKIQKIYEAITGKTYPVPDNEAMQWGRKYEDEARELYCKTYGTKVIETGALRLDFSKNTAVSPDGIIYDGQGFSKDNVGVLEIKCPGIDNHIKYMTKGECPPNYYAQVQAEILATGSDKAHFMSYRPDLPSDYKMFVVEVDRDEEYIEKVLIKNIKNALVYIQKQVKLIKQNQQIEEAPF